MPRRNSRPLDFHPPVTEHPGYVGDFTQDQNEARTRYIHQFSSNRVDDRIKRNHSGPTQYSYVGGKYPNPIDGDKFQRKPNHNATALSSQMKYNFKNTQYSQPLSHTPGMRQNKIIHEWRKGDQLLRKTKQNRRPPPGRSPLARNAEINIFTGHVKSKHAEMKLKEVRTLRHKGINAISPIAGINPRTNGLLDGGEKFSDSYVKPGAPPASKPAPWDVLDQRKAARDAFRRQEYQRTHANNVPPWKKKPRPDGRNIKIRSEEYQYPWQKTQPVAQGVKRYGFTHQRRPAPWMQ